MNYKIWYSFTTHNFHLCFLFPLISLDVFIQKMSSPGGPTSLMLEALTTNGFDGSVYKGVAAAVEKCQKQSKE
jgi:pyrroline-5-carboxylate reductase